MFISDKFPFKRCIICLCYFSRSQMNDGVGWGRGTSHVSFVSYSVKACNHKRFTRRGGGGEALECNLTGKCPFFKNLHNLFRKKICISIPCFGIIRLQKFPKTIGKTILHCSENNSLLFLNK